MYLDHSAFSCILHETEVDEKCLEKKFIFFITKKKTVDKTIMAEQQTHFSLKLERLLTRKTFNSKDFWKYLYTPNLLIKAGICIL